MLQHRLASLVLRVVPVAPRVFCILEDSQVTAHSPLPRAITPQERSRASLVQVVQPVQEELVVRGPAVHKEQPEPPLSEALCMPAAW